MKFICEIVRYNDLPQRQRKSDNLVVGCFVAVCDESNIKSAPGSEQLVDIFPHYLLFDFSEDDPPRLHQGFGGEDLHRGTWTVEKGAIFNTFNEAIGELKGNWPDIEKGIKALGGKSFDIDIEEILKPDSDDMQKVMKELFGK